MKKQYPIKWAKRIDYFSNKCYVPIKFLEKVFYKKDVKNIIKRKSKIKDSFYFTGSRFPLSLRYINSAFVWFQVLRSLKFKGKVITELCQGNSLEREIALDFFDYGGLFYSIDSSLKTNKSRINIRRSFKKINKSVNAIFNFEEIPSSDMIILNHSLDDLFIGLWASDKKRDYFKMDFDIKKDKSYWKEALLNKDKYIPEIRKFFKNLVRKLKNNGFIIIAEYVSAFEIYYNLQERSNLVNKITRLVKKDLLDEGLKLIKIDLSEIKEFGEYKPINMFLVLKKNG